MLSSHVIPVSDEQAALACAPKLDLAQTRPSEAAKMAGNSMSIPCLSAVLLTALLALEKVP